MIELALIVAAAAHRRARELQAEQDRYINTQIGVMLNTAHEIYRRAIEDQARHFARRLLTLQLEFQRQRCADIVAHFDRSIYVHQDGQITAGDDRIGQC